MATMISVELFKQELLTTLTEATESVFGIFLDRGTSLFETLAQISADDASKPVGAKCASIAAQTAHINFYMEVLEQFLITKQNTTSNWDDIWNTVRVVTPNEWDASRARLQATYQRLRTLIETYDSWDEQYAIAGAIGLVAHTAYHLGEIRQATCTVVTSS